MKKIRVRNHRVVLNRSKGGDFGINIMLLLIGAFMFIPMIYSVMNAFKPLEEFFYFPPHFFPRRLTLENFTYLFQLMSSSWVPFSRYIFNTVFITVAGVLGNLIISSLCAYALSKIPFPGHKFFFQLIQKSLMFSATVAGIINFISMSLLGWVDSYLAIIVPAWATTTGLYLMKQFMDSNVSDAVLESARLDGSSEFNTFFRIAMPMVKPAWLTLIIYSFQGLWQTGSSTFIYSEELKTVNYAIGQILSAGAVRNGASAASSFIMMVVPIVVFLLSQSQIIETMGSSGMKD
ncbi:MAG: carbohydrate ABC transporter permease [Lachnospiraceae bacterium]